MKVLLVNGSPNKKGCTYTALNEVANTLNDEGFETEIFWIETKPITGCIACGKCGDLGKCIFDNDVVNEFVKKAYDADAFVFGSPVYYAGANGSMTSFLDRAFYSNSHGAGAKAFKHKPGAVVCSARRAGTTATYDQLIKYLGTRLSVEVAGLRPIAQSTASASRTLPSANLTLIPSLFLSKSVAVLLRWKLMLRLSSTPWAYTATSGSKLRSALSELSTMWTSVPKPEKRVENSRAIGPPPTITRRRGSLSICWMEVDVYTRGRSAPGTGGMMVSEPVSMTTTVPSTTRSFASVLTAMVRSPTKRPSPRITCTPAASAI